MCYPYVKNKYTMNVLFINMNFKYVYFDIK